MRSKDKEEEKQEEQEQDGLRGSKALVQTPVPAPPPICLPGIMASSHGRQPVHAGPSHIKSLHITSHHSRCHRQRVTPRRTSGVCCVVTTSPPPPSPSSASSSPCFFIPPPLSPFLFEPLFLSCQTTTVCSVQCHRTLTDDMTAFISHQQVGVLNWHLFYRA